MAQHMSLPAVGLHWWERVYQSTDCVQDQPGPARGVTLTGTLWWHQFHWRDVTTTLTAAPELWELSLMLGMLWPDEPSHSQIRSGFLHQVQSAKDDLTVLILVLALIPEEIKAPLREHPFHFCSTLLHTEL